MIVTCPVCSTRYVVDPRAISAAGRLVRCASCAHTWHQMPQDDEGPRRIELTAPEPVVEHAPPGRVQLPALPRRKSRLPALLWTLYFLVLLGLIGGGLWWARDQVVAYWPPAARYYDLLGVPAPPAPSELEIQKLATSRDLQDGLETLVIQGEVVNVSKTPRKLPKLKVILQDGDKHELQSWSFDVTDDQVPPGGVVPFRTSVSQPSAAVRGVVVTLDTRALSGS
jgi:predicted Zn finger-like uncharacterized protein